MKAAQRAAPPISEAEVIVIIDKIVDHYWRKEQRSYLESPADVENPHIFWHLQGWTDTGAASTNEFINGSARSSSARPPHRRAFLFLPRTVGPPSTIDRRRSSCTQPLPDRTQQRHSTNQTEPQLSRPRVSSELERMNPTPDAHPVADSPTVHLTSNRTANANECSTPDAPVGAFTQPTANAANLSARAGCGVNNGVNQRRDSRFQSTLNQRVNRLTRTFLVIPRISGFENRDFRDS